MSGVCDDDDDDCYIYIYAIYIYSKNARIYSDVGESKGFIKTGEIEGKRDTERQRRNERAPSRERLSYGKNLKPRRFVPRATRVTIYTYSNMCVRAIIT